MAHEEPKSALDLALDRALDARLAGVAAAKGTNDANAMGLKPLCME